MAGIHIVILICSMAVDHAACRPDTAVDVAQGPKVSMPSQCGFLGQSSIATTAITPRPGEEYMKVICERDGAPRKVATAARQVAEIDTTGAITSVPLGEPPLADAPAPRQPSIDDGLDALR